MTGIDSAWLKIQPNSSRLKASDDQELLLKDWNGGQITWH